MRHSKLFLGLLLAFSSSVFADTPPVPPAGTPGGALPNLPQPFLTSLPVFTEPAPKLQKQAPAPAETTGLRFYVKKIDVLGMSTYPKVSLTKLNELTEKLQHQLEDKDGKLSVADLNKIAEVLEDYIRAQGYFLSKVYIPVQKITSAGIVHLQAQHGHIERIEIDGKSIYTPAQLEEPLEKYLNRPITYHQLEDALLTINSYPGITVTAVFEPGKNYAGSILILHVLSSHRLDILVSGERGAMTVAVLAGIKRSALTCSSSARIL